MYLERQGVKWRYSLLDIPGNLELSQEKSVLGVKTRFSEKCGERRGNSTKEHESDYAI